MADETQTQTVVLYHPDGTYTDIALSDGTKYTSDATGKVSGINPRDKGELLAHGLLPERPGKDAKETMAPPVQATVQAPTPTPAPTPAQAPPTDAAAPSTEAPAP